MRLSDLKNAEQGIALTVGAFVMVVLFIIATAFFISVQSETNKSLAEKARIHAYPVADAGSERALWYIQKKLEDANWIPKNLAQNGTLKLFNSDYDQFVKPRTGAEAKSLVYTQYGVKLGGSSDPGSQLYAAKMVYIRTATPPEGDFEEWALYSAGITRSAGVMAGGAKSHREIRAIKTVIRIPTAQPGWPGEVINFDGLDPNGRQTLIYPNTRQHIAGGKQIPVIYSANGQNNDPVTTGVNNATYPFNYNPAKKFYQSDGYAEDAGARFIFETAKSSTGSSTTDNVPTVPESVLKPGDIHTNVNRQFPNLNINQFGIGTNSTIQADYFYDPSKGDELNPTEYNPDDLRALGWVVVTNPDSSKSLMPPTNTTHLVWGRTTDASLTATVLKNQGEGRNVIHYTNHNGADQYTVIYIPKGGPNLRIAGFLGAQMIVMPSTSTDRTQAVIVSQGSGSNLYGSGTIKTERVYGDPDKYGFVYGTSNNPNFPGGEGMPQLFGADMVRDGNVGIEIRGQMGIYDTDWGYGAGGSLDFSWNSANNWPSAAAIDRNGNFKTFSNTSMPESTLSLLSDDNIIITSDGELGGASMWSNFRGLIYSKKKVRLQGDVLIRGAIFSGQGTEHGALGRSTYLVDESKVWLGIRTGLAPNGYDLSMCLENIFDLDNGGSAIPMSLRPSSQLVVRRLTIVSQDDVSNKM